MFANEAIDEGDECLARAGQDEFFHPRIPVEFEARGQRGDPDLAQRRIGCDDEWGAGIIEEDVQDAVLLFHFECGVVVFLTHDEMTLQTIEGRFGGDPELVLKLHGPV